MDGLEAQTDNGGQWNVTSTLHVYTFTLPITQMQIQDSLTLSLSVPLNYIDDEIFFPSSLFLDQTNNPTIPSN
jgi:hypothetical protein